MAEASLRPVTMGCARHVCWLAALALYILEAASNWQGVEDACDVSRPLEDSRCFAVDALLFVQVGAEKIRPAGTKPPAKVHAASNGTPEEDPTVKDLVEAGQLAIPGAPSMGTDKGISPAKSAIREIHSSPLLSRIRSNASIRSVAGAVMICPLLFAALVYLLYNARVDNRSSSDAGSLDSLGPAEDPWAATDPGLPGLPGVASLPGLATLPPAKANPKGVNRPAAEWQAKFSAMESRIRQRAASLLLTGALLWLFAFSVAAVLGALKLLFEDEQTNLQGGTFSSGFNYFPMSISEMVSDPHSAAGKCFCGFCLMGAVSILTSWYPWELSNAHAGDARLLQCVSWNVVRQFVPPIGMMLVVCLPSPPTAPVAQASAWDASSIWLHAVGEMTMIGAFVASEIHILAYAEKVQLKRRERRLRWTLTSISFVAAIGVQLCGLLVASASNLGLCCDDVWRVPNSVDMLAAQTSGHYGTLQADIAAAEEQRRVLYDTAKASVLSLKVGAYVSEVTALLSMAACHLTIWHFCTERQMDTDKMGATLVQ